RLAVDCGRCLPLLARRIRLRLRAGDDSKRRVMNVMRVRNRLNSPSPVVMAVLIDGPSCATTIEDFRAPLIINPGDCQRKGGHSRYYDSAKNSAEKHIYRLFRIVLSDHLVIALNSPPL